MQRMCNATCGVIQPRGSCTFTQRERKRKEYDTIFNFLEYGKYPGGCTKNHKRALRQKGKNYAVDGGLMYRKSQRKGGAAPSDFKRSEREEDSPYMSLLQRR